MLLPGPPILHILTHIDPCCFHDLMIKPEHLISLEESPQSALALLNCSCDRIPQSGWFVFFLKKKKSSSHFWRLESRRSRGLHLTRKHSQDDSIRSFRREELSWQIIRKTPPLNTATVRFKLSRYKLRGHIPIIYTVWIVGILTDLWTVPDFFPDFTNMERGFYLKKEKKKEKKENHDPSPSFRDASAISENP